MAGAEWMDPPAEVYARAPRAVGDSAASGTTGTAGADPGSLRRGRCWPGLEGCRSGWWGRRAVGALPTRGLCLGSLALLGALVFIIDRAYQYGGAAGGVQYQASAAAQWPPDAVRDPGPLEQRLPQCIIIGIRKCGTRALLEFLSLHPDVRAADEEIHFFDRDDQYERGLNAYRRQMPLSAPGQITIEKTPGYFIGALVPPRIRHMNSSIRMLLIVRDPVVRTLSDYAQVYSYHVERNESYPTFAERVLDRDTGEINLNYKPIWIGQYDLHWAAWAATFPRDQIHVVNGDMLIMDPLPELRKVEEFLGLRHHLSRDHFYWNATKGFHCLVSGAGRRRCLAASKGRPHPPAPPGVLDKLRDFFRPHNLKFSRMTGMTFDWT